MGKSNLNKGNQINILNQYYYLRNKPELLDSCQLTYSGVLLGIFSPPPLFFLVLNSVVMDFHGAEVDTH